VNECDNDSDEDSSTSLLASPRGGPAAGRDLQTALAAVESQLQQLLINSASTPANVYTLLHLTYR